jgi:hypothetical protein
MNPQEAELLSDGMKIGFPIIGALGGAFVGSLSAYFLAKGSQKHDVTKELSKRRFELLMEIARDVAEFEHLLGSYAVEVSNKVQGLKGALDFDEARTNVYTKNQPLRRARMNLKILGLSEAEAHLEAYVELTREAIRFNVTLSKKRASELAALIVVGPVKFYEALGKEISLK